VHNNNEELECGTFFTWTKIQTIATTVARVPKYREIKKVTLDLLRYICISIEKKGNSISVRDLDRKKHMLKR